MSELSTISTALFGVSAALGMFGINPAIRKTSAVVCAIASASLFAPAFGLLTNDATAGGLIRGVVLLAIAISATLAALHSLTYASSWDRQRRAAIMASAFPVFIASMSMVARAQDFLMFLVFWEVMTIASAVLVGIDQEEPANREALVWYLAIGHLSPALFVLAMTLLTPAGYQWSDLAAAAAAAPPLTREAAFVLVLIGASAKAGLVPLHSWLPRAHPAAPSHVSAVMSGSMVTLGALAFFLLGPEILGYGPAWQSWAIITLGVASALTGALYALVANDLKRLLAYSTVENMGLVFLEIGTLVIANQNGLASLEALAMAAICAHIATHALAKTTLFLGAGSVIHLTDTRLLNRMGGVLKKDPLTGWGFIIAAASIIALPPLAGFTSEWLLIRGLMQTAAELRGMTGLAIAVALALVALTGGLAVAAYAKAVGIGLMGSLRKEAPDTAAPIGFSERAVLLTGALLVIFTPAAFVAFFHFYPAGGFGIPAPVFSDIANAAMRCLYIAAGLVAFGLLLILVTRGRALKVRHADPWACGLASLTARMQYTADSFSQPLARVFAAVLRPSITADVDVHPETQIVRDRAYERQSTVLFDRTLYTPALRFFTALSTAAKRLHNGRVSTYATWLLLAVITLMAYGRWGG